MYGPKKTNINHHKFYHPGSGKNMEKFEKAEEREAEREAATAEQRAKAERDRQAAAYERLKQGGSALGGPGRKFQRLELIPDRPAGGGIARGQAADVAESAETKTGLISKEEAAAAKKALDDARKEAVDPLLAIRRREAALLGETPADPAAKPGAPAPPPKRSSGLLDRLKRPRD